MNCANHSDQAAVAFCRTCGKPLCSQCTRDVRGVIYCESCLAARLEGAPAPGAGTIPPQPPNPYQPIGGPSAYMPPPVPPVNSGPNPTVAGILGAIPFGVGAVYCGQYVRGLVYLGIFVLTIVLHDQDIPGVAHAAIGIFQGFFWIYQIIDSVRTARAIQAGEPAPDPYGLVSMFGGSNAPAGATSVTGSVPQASSTTIPAAAVVLIVLGVVFLINTAFDFSLHRYWPVILIFLGVYLFAKQRGLLGTYQPGCMCERCRTRKLMGPAMLVTVGLILLLNEISRVSWDKTWPAVLLVIGVVKLLQSNASYAGHIGPLPPGPGAYPPAYPPTPGASGTYPDASQNPPAPPSQSIDPSSGEVKNV